MCNDLYGVDTNYSPYGSFEITNESSLLFLKAYSSKVFWRLLFALNITAPNDNTPICLSRYGEALFREDVELSLSQYYLDSAKERTEKEIELNHQTMLRLQAEARLAAIKGDVYKMEKIYHQIETCSSKRFPSASLEKEIIKSKKRVEKASASRQETIQFLTDKANLIKDVENG